MPLVDEPPSPPYPLPWAHPLCRATNATPSPLPANRSQERELFSRIGGMSITCRARAGVEDCLTRSLPAPQAAQLAAPSTPIGQGSKTGATQVWCWCRQTLLVPLMLYFKSSQTANFLPLALLTLVGVSLATRTPTRAASRRRGRRPARLAASASASFLQLQEDG